MSLLSLLFGAIVGLSLGLTGGGGAIFAVPLLVYGLGTPAREAVGISLAAVGVTAFVGFLYRWRLGEVELPTGLLFAVAGMLGAPVGNWLARLLPEAVLLLAFAVLMLVAASRMWQQASKPVLPRPECSPEETRDFPTCRRDAAGRLLLTSRCALLLLMIGVATGLLAGMFGVGGGFVIVPALVLFSGMSIHRAVGTSLMVIALVSVSGITAQVWSGQPMSAAVTGLFVLGGVAGLFVGQQIGRRLPAVVLQKVFAAAIVSVAGFVIWKNLLT
uniref:Probable membrane transporter protein n=1 Tax=Schlesneria paludicola TaxID=360056 RepID=A0A7C4QQK4_9PLAN